MPGHYNTVNEDGSTSTGISDRQNQKRNQKESLIERLKRQKLEKEKAIRNM